MPYKVTVDSHGYTFINYFKLKKNADQFARINRGGKKKAAKGVSVTVRKVKKIYSLGEQRVRKRKKKKRAPYRSYPGLTKEQQEEAKYRQITPYSELGA